MLVSIYHPTQYVSKQITAFTAKERHIKNPLSVGEGINIGNIRGVAAYAHSDSEHIAAQGAAPPRENTKINKPCKRDNPPSGSNHRHSNNPEYRCSVNTNSCNRDHCSMKPCNVR